MAQTAVKPLIGVIGGSGLYHLDNLSFITKVNPETPWGFASSPISIAALPSGNQIAFIARHGSSHTISPSDIPSRANISALKSLGIKAIIAFSAVGSLREEIKPGDFVLPTQIIDRTKGVRPPSFFSGMQGVVAHVGFGDPFSLRLVAWLEERVGRALVGRGVGLHVGKCVVCMEGPQFSTRAESQMYRAWGGDIINMSVLPEAKLAREAELSYALIATATDFDAWRPHEPSVTSSEIFKVLTQNADTSRHVAAFILEHLYDEAISSTGILTEEKGCMEMALMRPPEHEEDKKKLAFFLPEYFA